MTNNI